MKLDYILISFIVVTIFSAFVNASDSKSVPKDYPDIPVGIELDRESIDPDEYIDPKVIENIKDCIKDGDVYMFRVSEYPDRIRITKNVSIHNKNEIFYFYDFLKHFLLFLFYQNIQKHQTYIHRHL